MINSMTGYASGELTTELGELTWELRSVNHRYLEAQFKLPDGFRSQEKTLRDLVGERLQRGKLDASLQFRPSAAALAELRIDKTLAEAVLKRAAELGEQIDSPAAISASHSRLPSLART